MINYLYVAGGIESITSPLDSCERYDLKKNKWFEHKNRLPYPLAGSCATVTVDQGFAVVTGGANKEENGR